MAETIDTGSFITAFYNFTVRFSNTRSTDKQEAMDIHEENGK